MMKKIVVLLVLVFGFNVAVFADVISDLQQGCDADSSISCYNLGVMYKKGQGVRQSNQKALDYFGKACDLKSQLGCKNYAILKGL